MSRGVARRKSDPFRVRADIFIDGDTVVVKKVELTTLSRRGTLTPTKRQYQKIGAGLAKFLRSTDG